MLELPSRALRPLGKCQTIYGKVEHSFISAPFEIVEIVMSGKTLKINLKARDHQKCHYIFFDMKEKNGAAELFIRRRIAKLEGEPNEQSCILDITPFPIFNTPLTLRLFRNTVKGPKKVFESTLQP